MKSLLAFLGGFISALCDQIGRLQFPTRERLFAAAVVGIFSVVMFWLRPPQPPAAILAGLRKHGGGS